MLILLCNIFYFSWVKSARICFALNCCCKSDDFAKVNISECIYLQTFQIPVDVHPNFCSGGHVLDPYQCSNIYGTDNIAVIASFFGDFTRPIGVPKAQTTLSLAGLSTKKDSAGRTS